MAKSKSSPTDEQTQDEFRLNLETVPYSRTLRKVPDVCAWITPLGLFSRTYKTLQANNRKVNPPSSEVLKALYDSYPEMREHIIAPKGYQSPTE